jgi:hypothetical protein
MTITNQTLLTGACELPSTQRDLPDDSALARFHALMNSATCVEIYESPRDGAGLLYSSENPQDVFELHEALEFDLPAQSFHCMCIGEPEVRLFASPGQSKKQALLSITNHHGTTIRCSLWESDVHLKDVRKWVAWFEARGVPGPRREIEHAIAAAAQARDCYDRWMSAMPKSLVPIWQEIMKQGWLPFDALVEFVPNPSTISQSSASIQQPRPLPMAEAIRSALAGEFPVVAARLRAVFSWYGSGAGPWSGFPSYEGIAEQCLLLYETTELVSALRGTHLSQLQLEGAARFFAGWEFNNLRPRDRSRIPAELRKLLLEHAVTSGDSDKIFRADYAFKPAGFGAWIASKLHIER